MTTKLRGAFIAALVLVLGLAMGIIPSAFGQQDPPTVAVLVRADNPVDAFSASAVAGQLGGGVFLTGQDDLSPVAEEGIRALRPQRVIIAGGTNALSLEVESDAKTLGEELGFQVERFSGTTRVETARLISGLLERYEVSRPVIVRSDGSSSVDLRGLTVLGLPFETSIDFHPKSGSYFMDSSCGTEYVSLRGCVALSSKQARYYGTAIDGSNLPSDITARIQLGIQSLDSGANFCAQLFDLKAQTFVQGSEVCIDGAVNLLRTEGPAFTLPDRESDYTIAVRIREGDVYLDAPLSLRISPANG